MLSKDHQLHKQEITHGGARDGTELSDEDIRGKSGEAEMDNPNRDEPVGQNDATVLNELFGVVITTAAKYPVLVQQEVAAYRDEISHRYRQQRRQETTGNCYAAKIDNGDTASYCCKTHESENPFSIQQVRYVHPRGLSRK